NYEIEEDEVKIKPGYTPLLVRKHPIAVTIAKINDKLIVDPSLEEEQMMDTRLTMTTDEDGNICAIQKGGSGTFTQKQVLEAAKIAREKAAEIRKKLKW
ncbi:RNA-binding protein, partial [Candidatus Bathyarchaeota archaeon]|nr:RNA-binding protein [Candidatus Bathyarchaeota archaeon]